MAISLTPAAADRVRHFLAARGQGLGLRLGVRKTGCSGFAYVVDYADYTLDQAPQAWASINGQPNPSAKDGNSSAWARP